MPIIQGVHGKAARGRLLSGRSYARVRSHRTLRLLALTLARHLGDGLDGRGVLGLGVRRDIRLVCLGGLLLGGDDGRGIEVEGLLGGSLLGGRLLLSRLGGGGLGVLGGALGGGLLGGGLLCRRRLLGRLLDCGLGDRLLRLLRLLHSLLGRGLLGGLGGLLGCLLGDCGLGGGLDLLGGRLLRGCLLGRSLLCRLLLRGGVVGLHG